MVVDWYNQFVVEMRVEDRAYGRITINEPIIIELIKSSLMQRLQGINQSGGPVFLEPQRDITRFEHSIGVWYLLKRFGASLEEQIAGLLHDTPHTAFSHVVDFVFPNDDHIFHERFTERIILSSKVPEILRKRGIKIEKILGKEAYHLLDADLPDLSADRIDYFLRDTRPDKLFPDSLIGQFLDGIFVKDSKFYFKDKSLASLYAILFMNAGRLLWLDPNSHGSFFLLAGAIKRAMETGRLSEDDLFKTDQEVFESLKKINDVEVKKYMERLSPLTRFLYASKPDSEFFGPNKPRIVDPWVEESGRLIRVSSLVPRLREMFEHYKQTYKFLGVKAVEIK